MSKLWVGFVLMICCGSASANPMTCTEFREALEQAILDGGRRVATPDLTEITLPGLGTTRYAMTGIVGMVGSLQCSEGDRLWSLDADISITGKNDALDAANLLRIEGLFSAAICAVTPGITVETCDRKTGDLFDKVTRELLAAALRGEPLPRGLAEAALNGGFKAVVEAFPGGPGFSLRAPGPDLSYSNEYKAAIPDFSAGKGLVDSVK